MTLKKTNILDKLIYILYSNSRTPESEIAKKLNISRESVRYNINYLENNIIKGYGTWIDITKLGYRLYKLYLKVYANKIRIQDVKTHLKKRDDILWFGLGDGSWDIGLTIYAKNDEEFYNKKNELLAKFNDIIIDNKNGIIVSIHIYPLKTLDNTQKEITEIILANENDTYKIDEIDKKIINELFLNSRIKIVDLANNTNTTIDIVRNRIKSLQKNKIIKGFNVKLNYSELGYTYYKTFLYFNGLSKEDEDKLDVFCRLHPNILHKIKQISAWEVELEIIVKNYEEYNKLIHKLRDTFETIKNIESTVIFDDYVYPGTSKVFEKEK